MNAIFIAKDDMNANSDNLNFQPQPVNLLVNRHYRLTQLGPFDKELSHLSFLITRNLSEMHSNTNAIFDHECKQ